jgi:GcrA cell cycle regulator
MDWAEKTIEALKALWLEGKTAKEISLALGVTRNAVIGKVHRLGLSGRHLPAAPRVVAVQTPRQTEAQTRARTSAARVKRTAPTVSAAPIRRRFVETSDVSPTAQLLTLDVHSCRWPIGRPGDAEFGFCGREQAGTGSYCAHHQQFAYRRSRLSTAYIDSLVAFQ